MSGSLSPPSQSVSSLSVAVSGSGGAGVMTAGQALIDAAARAGWYGLMSRAFGPQIRGGEAAAQLRVATRPVSSMDDAFDLLVAVDWRNIDRLVADLPLTPGSVVIADPAEGDPPAPIAAAGARQVAVPLGALAKAGASRVNMVAFGLIAALIGLPRDACAAAIDQQFRAKGDAAASHARAGFAAGWDAAAMVAGVPCLAPPPARRDGTDRWAITGNEATGFGALKAGVRFCAAYPITPATEILEYLAPRLPQLGGILLQAEDELASINMCLGGSFGGVPALTATSGPGLALMTESLGLAVAAELPVVVVDVQRGGPSTGIPTKSEQADLDIAVGGLHGSAPHLVTAPLSIADCLFTTQWTVHLAETLQAPAILLSDQATGQARAIVDRPADLTFAGRRLTAPGGAGGAVAPDYRRYALTPSGVSPMALPGQPGGEYVADGLAHCERGAPSTAAGDNQAQLDKRRDKLAHHDYGDHWAEIEELGPDTDTDTDGDAAPALAVITWGSVTAQVREGLARLAAEGVSVRLIALRLLAPAQPVRMAAALAGVRRLLVVEQSHDAQFHRLLRAYYELPAIVERLNRPGPLALRPHEISAAARALAAR